MFKNKLTHNEIHYSRYIASWNNVIGNPRDNIRAFKEWLEKSEKLTQDEIQDIVNLLTNGKLELQESAKRFVYGE